MHVRKWIAGFGVALSIAGVSAAVGSCTSAELPPPEERGGRASGGDGGV